MVGTDIARRLPSTLPELRSRFMRPL